MEVSHESQSKHSMALTCTKTAPSAKFAYLPVENVIGLQESISNQVKILQWGSTTELDTLYAAHRILQPACCNLIHSMLPTEFCSQHVATWYTTTLSIFYTFLLTTSPSPSPPPTSLQSPL